MTHRFQFAVSILWAISALMLIAPAVQASEDAIGCVKILAIPGYQGLVSESLPAVIRVEILIGDYGRAKKVTYNAPVTGFRAELDDYFARKTIYSAACEGRTITFFVSYELQKDPAAITEVRFGPPDQILIIGHLPVVALDPVRPYQYEIKKK
jgi:hypothetical protein